MGRHCWGDGKRALAKWRLNQIATWSIARCRRRAAIVKPSRDTIRTPASVLPSDSSARPATEIRISSPEHPVHPRPLGKRLRCLTPLIEEPHSAQAYLPDSNCTFGDDLYLDARLIPTKAERTRLVDHRCVGRYPPDGVLAGTDRRLTCAAARRRRWR